MEVCLPVRRLQQRENFLECPLVGEKKPIYFMYIYLSVSDVVSLGDSSTSLSVLNRKAESLFRFASGLV